MKNIILFSMMILGFGFSTHAATSPLAVSIVPPVEFPPEDFDVTGVRASLLWGHHRQMYGVDIGLLGNITDKDFVGLALAGGFNYTTGQTSIIGLQLAGLTNINKDKTHVVGIQAALGMNNNMAQSSVIGLQLALANISPFTDIYGLQLGAYNKALNVYGVQIGIVNVAQNLHGLQIGLLNFNATGIFAVSPLLNFGF